MRNPFDTSIYFAKVQNLSSGVTDGTLLYILNTHFDTITFMVSVALDLSPQYFSGQPTGCEQCRGHQQYYRQVISPYDLSNIHLLYSNN